MCEESVSPDTNFLDVDEARAAAERL